MNTIMTFELVRTTDHKERMEALIAVQEMIQEDLDAASGEFEKETLF